jgi:hypothetical protein
MQDGNAGPLSLTDYKIQHGYTEAFIAQEI